MAGKKLPIKLRFGKSSPLTVVAVIAAMVLSIVALVALQSAVNNAEEDYEALRQQAAALVAENQQLSDRIASLGTVESAIQIAMEQLGLVEPDSIILDPGN